MLGFQAFQRGFIRRNRPRDDEARLKSLEEKPSVPAGGALVPAGVVNCSLYAAMELSSSFSVLGNLLRLVRNESSCSPWSFSAPSSEDLAWISNQVGPTRFFMIFHADHTCSWESWCVHQHTHQDNNRLTIFAHIYKTYRVELRAQANFSAPTFEPAHGARAGQRAALSVQSSQMQLRYSTSISGPQASSLRSERSAKRAVENVIAFCLADRTLSSKSLAHYFQCKKCKSQNVRRLQKREKKKRSTCGGRSRPPRSIVDLLSLGRCWPLSKSVVFGFFKLVAS